MDIKSMVSLGVGPSQLIAELCDELGVVDRINENITWHPSYRTLSPGTHVKALMINILCGRTPLYRVEEAFEGLDVEQLFGAGHKASDFNDDALGRTLDLIADAGCWNVYSKFSISAVNKLGLPLSSMHNDTTSFSFHGEYKDAGELEVTYGYNKDNRPDLKQIVIGLGVTPERLPLLGTIDNGNKDDKTWNREFIDKLRSMLSEEQWSELTYVADSALVTPGNIAKLAGDGGSYFVTRLPDTYQLGKELKEKAIADHKWDALGQMTDQEKSASYLAQSYTQTLYGHKLRFIVIHSSHLEKQQFATIERQIEQERKKVQEQLSRLEEERFACMHDATARLELVVQTNKWKWHTTEWTVESEMFIKPREKRGRPKAGEQPEEGTRYFIKLMSIQEKDDVITKKREQLGLFILVTNREENEAWPNKRVLQTYKGQESAETRFRLLKDPAILDAVYLKKTERIEALVTVFIMAIFVYGVLEWRVREAMKNETEALLIPGKKKSFTPTGEMLLLMLKRIQIILITLEDGQVIRRLSDHIDPQVKRVLRLAGYDETIYKKSNKTEKLTVEG